MPWSFVIPAAASVLGGFLSSRGSRGSTITTQGTQDPWSPLQPYLLDLFGRGQGLLGQPSIGPQSAYTQDAIKRQAGLATTPGLVTEAQDELGRTIRGDYLTGETNPYLDAAAQNAINRSLMTVSSRFGGENYGGSPSREWMARAATEAASPYYFGEYGRERDRQFQGLSMAPGLQYANIPQLYQAGAMEEARSQSEVDAPWMALTRYRGLLTGTPGGQTTQQTPYFQNPLASTLGGALGGWQLGGQLYRGWQGMGGPNQSVTPNEYQSGWTNAWAPFSQGNYYGPWE